MEPPVETNLRQLCCLNEADVPKVLDIDSICRLPVSHVLALVPIAQLKQLGFDASGLREHLGVRVIDLVAREALAGELRRRGCHSLLSSTDAQRTLYITPDQLLQACQHPVPSVTTKHAAAAVLHQLVEAHNRECATALVFRPSHPLSMVSIDTLLRVGLNRATLAEIVGVETMKKGAG
eukprot:266290-Prymnesium_polylepis.3